MMFVRRMWNHRYLLGTALLLLVHGNSVLSFVHPSHSQQQQQQQQQQSPVRTQSWDNRRQQLCSSTSQSWSMFQRNNPAIRTPTTWSSSSSSLHVSSKFFTKKTVEEGGEDDGSDDDTKLETTKDTQVIASLTEVLDDIALPPSVSKFRKLKDLMWVRECLEDLTAAEFALSVEQQLEADTTTSRGDSSNSGGINGRSSAGAAMATALPSQQRRKKRAVDYEKLLSQLTKRIEDMTCQPFVEMIDEKVDVITSESNDKVDQPKKTSVTIELDVTVLQSDRGMGRYAYSSEERSILLQRLLKTRRNIEEVLEGHALQEEMLKDESFLKLPEIPELRMTPEDGNSTSNSFGPKLYVREDGTVDWEGALQDRAALRKFGGAVWARINGQTPDDLEDEDEGEEQGKRRIPGHGSSTGTEKKAAVVAKIEETVAIQDARKELNRLQTQLREMEKEHTALLASGIKVGQPVANVKLASLDPALRNKIRQSAEHLLIMEQQVSYQSLVYELERIYTYLATELGNPSSKGYIPLQDRLNVAEYGLLESQVESCSRELESKGVLDADILAVIAEQMTDFKRRLGIDYYVTGLTFDRETIIRWLNDFLVKAKNGLMFYVKGTRLFFNDIVYCSSLIGRAAQGYTLKPREVRTIRRTFKDIITFIPVVIIWIIPLTPVGHVIVFGAIQRFFPDFFPSCFTEQRQNLLQLYETTEFSEFTIKESLQERLARFLEAFVFVVASKTRNLYTVLFSPEEEQTDQKGDND
ncbi:LETM1-like protein [Nitzschia inconspicua]|uniref:LETM1-like protein n=1 Tax=Nitzschia inconspicua TaxID=303405 RepID=A0A9K3L8V0_9STRA|nr:LETM1-like protein [Nitzschia inconspicua]